MDETDELYSKYSVLQTKSDSLAMIYDQAHRVLREAQQKFGVALHFPRAEYDQAWTEYHQATKAYDKAQRDYREGMAQADKAWEAYRSTWVPESSES